MNARQEIADVFGGRLGDLPPPADAASDAGRWAECGIAPHTPDGNLRTLAMYRG